MKLIVTKWKQGVGVFGFEDNTLVEANVYDNKQKICIGDIYLGRINKILPNINACFVQIGEKEEVFLPFDEICENVKSGDYTLIQIKKEASKGKQALGTTRLSLAGLYCVVNHEPYSIEVSSKLNVEKRNYWKKTLAEILQSEELSPEDKAILLKYCLIIRTNVSETSNSYEVISEWISLAKKMEYILEKGKYQSLFSKLYSEEKQYLNYIKNVSQSELTEIVTDEADIFDELKNIYAESPEMQNKLRFYQDAFPLNKLYSIESKITEALSKKVWLKCGGFLVIEPTEALTVIDVNSGKYDKKGDSEAFYKKVNEEAACEIARQIKLRNISGIIIIDFINMSLESNQKALLDTLSRYVSKDKVKTHVIGMTSLGLVEMTRTKTAKPLSEQIYMVN